MPLHLNLHHEIQKQQRQRQRDPLKLGMLALLVVAIAFVIYYVYRRADVAGIERKLTVMQNDWQALEAKAQAAKTREEQVTGIQKATVNLVSRIEDRFYWAPVFESIQKVVPPEVQLIRIEGDFGKDLTRRGVITINGLSTGDDPRKVAEDLRTGLLARFSEKHQSVDAKFASLDESSQQIEVNGTLFGTASFTINMEFTATPSTAAAPPAPRRERKKIP